MQSVGGTACDEPEPVDAYLDGLFDGPSAVLLAFASDHVNLLRERVEAGALALVEEHGQIGIGCALYAQLLQCGHLRVAPTVLFVGDGETVAHYCSSGLADSIPNTCRVISVVNILSTNPRWRRTVTVCALPFFHTTPGGSSPPWSSTMSRR